MLADVERMECVYLCATEEDKFDLAGFPLILLKAA